MKDMIRTQRRLPEMFNYELGKAQVIDLPRDSFITEIRFLVYMRNGSQKRFNDLISNSKVSLLTPIGDLDLVFTQEEITHRNSRGFIWHPGIISSDRFDESNGIEASAMAFLSLRWMFPDFDIGSKAVIMLDLFSIFRERRSND